MNIPAWATPLDFARTHHIYLCDCSSHYPAVMEATVTWLQRIPKAAGGWGFTVHEFVYRLCAICYIYELEIQGEIDYAASEALTEAYKAAYERVGYKYSDRGAQTINGLAERAYKAARAATTTAAGEQQTAAA